MKRLFALLAAVMLLAMGMTACKSDEEKALEAAQEAAGAAQDMVDDILG